jgi:hypothetical protein
VVQGVDLCGVRFGFFAVVALGSVGVKVKRLVDETVRRLNFTS